MSKPRKIDAVPPDILQQAYGLIDQGKGAATVWRELLTPFMSRRLFQDIALTHRREHGAAVLRDVLSLCQALAPKLTRALERAACLETWSYLRGQARCRDLPDSTIDKLAAEKIKRLWPGVKACPSGIRHWRQRSLAMGAFNDLVRGALELWNVTLQSKRGAA